jgi:hypothetical protein
MDGQTVSVTLEGETEPTLFKVKNVTNGAEFIQDWTPVNGWGGRTEVKLPLDFLCYPRDPEKHGAITFSVQNTAAPAAEKPSLKVGANSQYLGFEFDPADPQFIYWIKITPTDYKWNNGQIPLMISSQSSSGKGAYTQLAGWGESCVWSLYLNPCVEYSVTAFSEDLIGRKSAVSDPVYVTLGTGPDGSFWKMGDPMNCSSGCSCSNVGL